MIILLYFQDELSRFSRILHISDSSDFWMDLEGCRWNWGDENNYKPGSLQEKVSELTSIGGLWPSTNENSPISVRKEPRDLRIGWWGFATATRQLRSVTKCWCSIRTTTGSLCTHTAVAATASPGFLDCRSSTAPRTFAVSRNRSGALRNLEDRKNVTSCICIHMQLPLCNPSKENFGTGDHLEGWEYFVGDRMSVDLCILDSDYRQTTPRFSLKIQKATILWRTAEDVLEFGGEICESAEVESSNYRDQSKVELEK